MKVKIPHGESITELSRRVKKGLSLILYGKKGRTIALITHGGPIRFILCDALKFNLNAFWKIEQNICALNIVDHPENSLSIVSKMNNTSHLFIQEAVTL